ncbi:MAG: PH domain-containing protein [Candidatus Limnocylindrales bacterium]
MSYADGLLSTGERVMHREKQHWFVFVWGAKWAVLALLLGLVVLVLSQGLSADQRSGPLGTFLNVAVAVLVVGGLAVLGWHILRYLNQEYVLTNRRVVQVAGVLNKTSTDSSLEKINDARLSQSVFGRIFGFGDLDILTAAETGVERFRMIRNPIGFKKAMLDAKHEYERDVAGGSSYDTSPPLRAPSPVADPAPMRPAVPAPPPVAPASPVQPPTAEDTVVSTTPGSAASGSAAQRALSSDDLTRTLANLADLRDRGAITADEYERKKADLLGRL